MDLVFDRGTLLLHSAPEPPAQQPTPAFLWDGRVRAWRAPAHRYYEIVAALSQRTDALIDRVGALPRERLPIALPILRGYQREALAAWELAGRRGVVVLPTGAGKTHVALGAIGALAAPTVVLVPTRALLFQWRKGLASIYGGDIGVFGDGHQEVRPLTVCTFESALRHMDRFGERFALLIVDEAHHFGSGARCEALEMCPAPARLGLTATAPEDPGALTVLDQLIGPIVCERPMQDFVGSHLARLEHSLLLVDLDPDERRRYEASYQPFSALFRAFRRTSPGLRWGDFVRAVSADPEGRRVLQGYRDAVQLIATARAKLDLARELLEHHREDRTLVFTASNQVAYTLSRRLLIPAITCDIKARERESVLARFRAGKLRALVSSRVLNEGLDVPDARVAIVLGGRQGRREHVQRIGRVLRPAPDKVALVYELVARDTFEAWHSWRRRGEPCCLPA